MNKTIIYLLVLVYNLSVSSASSLKQEYVDTTVLTEDRKDIEALPVPAVYMDGIKKEWYFIVPVSKLKLITDECKSVGNNNVFTSLVNVSSDTEGTCRSEYQNSICTYVRVRKDKQPYTFIEFDTIRNSNLIPTAKKDTALRSIISFTTPPVPNLKPGTEYPYILQKTNFRVTVGFPRIIEFAHKVKVPKNFSPDRRMPRTVIGRYYGNDSLGMPSGVGHGELVIIYVSANSTINEIQERLISLGVEDATVVNSKPFIYYKDKLIYNSDVNAGHKVILGW